MGICVACGEVKSGLVSGQCSDCRDKPASPTPSMAPVPTVSRATHSSLLEQAKATACAVVGTICLLIGLYFLFHPAVDGSVANIHRLTIGQTFSIMAAIFLAAGLGPRR